jgi:hypothetical protein
MLNDIAQLSRAWMEAKQNEREATEARRAIEDQICALTKETELTLEGYKIKINARIDYKIDADLLQEVAAEAGLSGHLSSLFRWKPDINVTAWKAADDSITRALSAAITAKPGRPSFSLTKTANKE